jgi:hypothetical protein
MNTTLENELIAGMREQAEEWEPTRDVLASAFSRHRRRQRNHRAATVVSMLAAASATIAAIGVIPAPIGGGHSNSPPDVAGSTALSEGGGEVTVDSVLSRAALAAAQVEHARNDQFVYTLSVGYGMMTSDTPPYLTPQGRTQTRSWMSVDGRHGSLTQTRPDDPDASWTEEIRDPGCYETAPNVAKAPSLSAPDESGTEPGVSPTPQARGAGDPCTAESVLEMGLPTTTDEMLAWLYANGASPWGMDPEANDDTYAWFAAVNLVGNYMPPSSEEALYSALRKIPDVYLIPDTQDAAGRTTVAVARRSGNTAHAILFDPETGSYRGSMSTLTQESLGKPAGTVLSSEAELTRAIVSKPGQMP